MGALTFGTFSRAVVFVLDFGMPLKLYDLVEIICFFTVGVFVFDQNCRKYRLLSEMASTKRIFVVKLSCFTRGAPAFRHMSFENIACCSGSARVFHKVSTLTVGVLAFHHILSENNVFYGG